MKPIVRWCSKYDALYVERRDGERLIIIDYRLDRNPFLPRYNEAEIANWAAQAA